MDFYIHLAALIASLIVACLTLGVMHYYPHTKARTGKDLSSPDRLTGNYKNGTLAIFIPFTIWLGFVWIFDRPAFNLYAISASMWLHIIAGGFSVIQMYRHDKDIEKGQNLKDEKEKNALLERQRRDAETKRT